MELPISLSQQWDLEGLSPLPSSTHHHIILSGASARPGYHSITSAQNVPPSTTPCIQNIQFYARDYKSPLHPPLLWMLYCSIASQCDIFVRRWKPQPCRNQTPFPIQYTSMSHMKIYYFPSCLQFYPRFSPPDGDGDGSCHHGQQVRQEPNMLTWPHVPVRMLILSTHTRRDQDTQIEISKQTLN
jgi:hypothetical protein